MSKTIRLSKRLEVAASLVSPGSSLADIGTDHGWLPIALAQSGRINKAIACDVREGPLSRAKTHIAEAGLSGKIETRLSDGFSSIRPGEADTAAILGMGGALMEKIIAAGKPETLGIRTLILGPQSEVPRVRSFLLGQGYAIEEERLIFEDGKYYFLLRVSTSPEREELPYNEAELLFGRSLAECDRETLREYLRYRSEVLREILEHLDASVLAASRKQEVNHELTTISEALSQLS